jgi:CRISPR/Cas system-associated exonuclease Cas4 (RecB family)
VETKKSIVDEMCDILFKKYSAKRTGIHVSDLVFCPRKIAFEKILDKKVGYKELSYFFFGGKFHTEAQLLSEVKPSNYTTEKEFIYNDIVAHVDIYDETNDIVYEIKTVRDWSWKGPKSHNIAQIKAYLAVSGAKQGFLWYLLLNVTGSNPFRLVEVTITPAEKEEILQKLDEDAENLRASLAFSDVKYARHIRDNPDFNWLCKTCPYWNQCIKADER